MPMLLGTKGDDILQWRASTDLVAGLKELLTRKWEQCSSGAAQSFLEEYLKSLREELEFEAHQARELEALKEGISQAGSPAEILPLRTRYLEVASVHFRRRRSVLALCDLCCDLHDRLLSKAISFAEERMVQLGQGKAPSYAVLVCGDRGRHEQTLAGENRYFLLHEEQGTRFLLFRRQFASALQEVGLPGGGQTLWHGGLKEWRTFLGARLAHGEPPAPEPFLAALPPFATAQPEPQAPPGVDGSALELADLAFLKGEEPFAAPALAGSVRALQGETNGDPFLQLARRVVALPLALGRFGGWRLERSGKQKGRLNLKQYALDPLVMLLRVLALYAGDASGGSVQRIQLLQEQGFLDVELAERLLQAYQCIMQLKVLLEIRGDEAGLYCSPQDFSTETEARFRNALDTVQSLQKIGYQRLVGG